MVYSNRILERRRSRLWFWASPLPLRLYEIFLPSDLNESPSLLEEGTYVSPLQKALQNFYTAANIFLFIVIFFLADGNHFSCDSLVYDTLLPKEKIEVGKVNMQFTKHLLTRGNLNVIHTILKSLWIVTVVLKKILILAWPENVLGSADHEEVNISSPWNMLDLQWSTWQSIWP